MDFVIDSQLKIIFQLLLAVLLGGALGLEREYKRKEAGLRTYILVSLGAALFTIISFEANKLLASNQIVGDPLRVIQAVAIGIGFLGAGLIIQRQFRIEGLTTAAGLWVAAAIGIAVGIQLYIIATFVTFLVIGILAGLRLIEEKMFNK